MYTFFSAKFSVFVALFGQMRSTFRMMACVNVKEQLLVNIKMQLQIKFSINVWCAILGNRVLAVLSPCESFMGPLPKVIRALMLPAIEDLALKVIMQHDVAQSPSCR